MAAREYHQNYVLTHYLPLRSSGDMGAELESK